MYQSALKIYVATSVTMTGYMPIALQLYTQKTVEQDRFFFFFLPPYFQNYLVC